MGHGYNIFPKRYALSIGKREPILATWCLKALRYGPTAGETLLKKCFSAIKSLNEKVIIKNWFILKDRKMDFAPRVYI